MNKPLIAAAALVLTLGMTAALDAEAKRLGGGRNAGMQRQQTTQPANTPAQPSATPGAAGQTAPSAAPAAAAAPGAAAAAQPRRSWMGPVAGLAAGLGLAALASHFGFGEALANAMMIGLLVMVVLAVIGFVLRKRAASQQPAYAAANPAFGNDPQRAREATSTLFRTADAPPARGSLIGSRLGGSATAVPQGGAALPADFDAAAFARHAKDQFMGLQAANDAGDLDRLRDYLTPEMFEVVRADIAERGNAPQATQVFGLEAQVLGVAEEEGRYVVSVRFTGSVRDQHGAVPEDLDEVWHLTKPQSGMGGWVIAGIQQAGAGA